MTLVTPYYFLLFPLRELTRTQKKFHKPLGTSHYLPIIFPSFPITFPIIFPLYPHNFTVSYSFLSHSKYSHKKKREEKRGNTRKLSLYLLGSQDFSVCCPMRWEIEREKEEMRRNKRTGSGDKKREKEVVGECGKLPFWEWVKLPYNTKTELFQVATWESASFLIDWQRFGNICFIIQIVKSYLIHIGSDSSFLYFPILTF